MIGQRIYSGSAFEEKAGYARAVVLDDWVLVSGTTGFDPDTKSYPPDVEAQCENCFRTIARVLEQAGASLDDLVQLRIFVASRAEFERIVPIVKRHADAARPANTTVIAELVAPEMRVEVEATARIRPPRVEVG
jgi:enamine deaminase RidA (YjgF/YER057c/UK114 family)